MTSPRTPRQLLGAAELDAMAANTLAGRTKGVPVPAPVLSQDVPIPLSESVEANGGGEGASGDLRAGLVEALRLAAQTRPEDVGLSDHEQWYVDFNCVDCDAETLYAVLAHGLAAAGWRPPLPAPACTCEYPYDGAPGSGHHPGCDTFGPPLPADELIDLAAERGHDSMFEGALPNGIERALWQQVVRAILSTPGLLPPKVPADEVEWGCRTPAGRIFWPLAYGDADDFVKGDPKSEIVRRTVGPWSVVEPVEPKETK